MTITHLCESCGQAVAVPEQHVGRRLYCSSCQAPFVVPLPGGRAAPGGTCPSCRAVVLAGAVFCNQCGFNLEEGTPAPAVRLPRSGGPSLGPWLVVVVIGGLVAIGIIGIIAAIAIPNLLNAIERGRQKRTASDIRTIATAVEAFREDKGAYPAGLTSPDQLTAHLVPTYLVSLPTTDGWSNPLVVESPPDGSGFAIMSYGRDGQENPYVGGEVVGFDTDLIFEDGVWVQWPQGIDR